ncbi:G2/mitotic-specific cyclin-B2 [Ahaetulla prasina]|uniref:G2/mitotic-specific cyclin-B2 n=1 Tax=Ahaetulla prasina TaxID=499056 RepID=UPI0026492455|nr:G2/mitotic-specific cyclin-B2 [Ahaetulla prasina]
MKCVLNLIRAPLQGKVVGAEKTGGCGMPLREKRSKPPSRLKLPLILYCQPSAEMYLLAKYLMELTLVDYEMVHYSPSEIVAALPLEEGLLTGPVGSRKEIFQHQIPGDQHHPAAGFLHH